MIVMSKKRPSPAAALWRSSPLGAGDYHGGPKQGKPPDYATHSIFAGNAAFDGGGVVVVLLFLWLYLPECCSSNQAGSSRAEKMVMVVLLLALLFLLKLLLWSLLLLILLSLKLPPKKRCTNYEHMHASALSNSTAFCTVMKSVWETT